MSNHRYTQNQMDDIVRMYFRMKEQGLKGITKQIAKYLDVTQPTVYYILHKAGVHKKRQKDIVNENPSDQNRVDAV